MLVNFERIKFMKYFTVVMFLKALKYGEIYGLKKNPDLPG